ncbi:YjbH domain-containing protein [Erwinia amylovora]|uniref:YjbH domain-containing protein n=1 Tax=Erwinia amylovora TaxID=552 RepID=UPI00211EDFE2|nr:YjbH domain-containing protein [Erwinia amylovora]
MPPRPTFHRKSTAKGTLPKVLYFHPAGCVQRDTNPGSAQINWTPLTRDGGQMLGRKYQLYDMTSDRDASYR